MTVGAVKGDEAVIINLTADSTVAVGDLCHIGSASGWHETDSSANYGKFAVAIEASANGEFRGVVWGRVEVGCKGATPAGCLLVPSATAGFVAAQRYEQASMNVLGIVGTSMDASVNLLNVGGTGTVTVWMGLVN